MAEVYWIRDKNHTDIFSQGYVGVTSKTAVERYKEHTKTANSKSGKSIVHKVIKARGSDNLVVETVCICEEDYAYDLENKLRPIEYIGWNQNVGGSKPPSPKGRIMSDETKSKISKANSGPASEAKRKALLENRHYKLGDKREEATNLKHKETMKLNGPWNNPSANRDLWESADTFYKEFLSGLGCVLTARKYNITSTLFTMFKHFKKGWIPHEDEKWLADFNKESIYGP